MAREVHGGHLRAVVAGVHPLDAVADAHRAFERGGTVGKQVVVMTGAPAR